jgi:hypothetical protein
MLMREAAALRVEFYEKISLYVILTSDGGHGTKEYDGKGTLCRWFKNIAGCWTKKRAHRRHVVCYKGLKMGVAKADRCAG